MNLHTVEKEYLVYLKLKGHVKIENFDYIGTDKLYLGVIFSIKGMNYFAPLSSGDKESKRHFLYNTDGTVKADSIARVLLVDKKGKILGYIKIGNMIPVPPEHAILYDPSSEQNLFYRNLINDELVAINKKDKLIIRFAKSLYEQKVLGKERGIKNTYIENSLDFLKLEKDMIEYCKINGFDTYR